MKYNIIFSSKTGNTAMLAEAIKSYLHEDECLYFGSSEVTIPEADMLFIGFWTDKGTCSEELLTYLKQLHHQRIFLFGTAGFGQDITYFDRILANVKSNIASDNEVIDGFMCQGKMPMAIRARYVEMAKSNPKMQAMVDNFDQAMAHPNSNDLMNLKQTISKCMDTCKVR